ncbi:MAG TPA: hypothetical protein VI653_27980 [Steroidobacteraceae bacterium]
MTDLPLSTRIQLYLYSTRNIVACAAALVGPALLFLGVIREGWLLITAALYAAGYFATPAPQVLDAGLAQSLSFDALLERFDRLVNEARAQLPPRMVGLLDSIRRSIQEVLPRLTDTRAFDDNLFTVRETIARYLPETLANYVALPPIFRVTRILKDGKTARDLLMDQLVVLDNQMKEVVANVARGDADALLANGQFLEAKFRERDFIGPAAAGKKTAA